MGVETIDARSDFSEVEMIAPTGTILLDIKKFLGISSDYTIYDKDLLMFINSSIASLQQIGAGDNKRIFFVEKETNWEDYLPPGQLLQTAKEYIFLRVRLVFDPPEFSFQTTAIRDQLKELEWRIHTMEK